ncbi:hypothetical protein BDZ89DRAFT_928787, partial [Hymenopellis radicata]
EEDESDDEDDGPTSSSRKNNRRPYPGWFQHSLDKALAQLEKDRATLSGVSQAYSSGTFWLPRRCNFFNLNHSNICPQDLFIPAFFVWDPAAIMSTGIPCPSCNLRLTRDGVVKRPRRIVDIDDTFWIIGYSYACRSCKLKLRSWDSRVLKKLSRPLAAEFPARLTWRSGISTRALGVVRSCIQNGMGAHQVADMFRMQHLRRYDELRVCYLHTKVSCMNLPTETYEPFPAFDDKSEKGFHGFVPSGQWFRDVYDAFVECFKHVFNQHTAMLSALVCAIDHSHKLAKHIFKLDGVSIFTALLTVTNEKGEIRVCVFVATKSHSQFEEALKKMSESLHLYGHEQPVVFYTDNMSDKPMLESIFDSLLQSVVAVEKHSNLPKFMIPSDTVTTTVLDSTSAIDNALQAIMSDLHSGSGRLAVGFDSEWNVEVSQHGHVTGRGSTAVVQIAYKDQIFILLIGEMLATKRLPLQLLNFLRDGRILKAGRLVNGDLRQLEAACDLPRNSFVGGLELGAFAKERFLISSATISLADLTARILGKCLPKNVAERIS